ncbi:MAG TPA: tRNA lysidine(34) synthetase TilS [Candidatus Dwaynia gallinarum]|nr:tRNA lysidine(34) synthetase TilS [Candidatus Dwaynia gallinarum]
MLDVIHRVKNFINFNKLILENDVVACALSGGADSIFMTYVLNKISYEMNFKIIGIHVNHMLRGEEAYEDELFVEKFCKHNNIEFKIYRVDVKEYSKKNKISIEMAGREVRYKIFEDLKKENIITKCALAHHADDDVETILMRIFKGTGIKGIEGIKEIRENFYVRPILFLRRNSEIEKFLNINNIKFVFDKTNFSQNYLRNKLRLSIIPSINESFSMDITKNILNLKELSKYDNEFFDEVVEDYIKKYVEISGEYMYIDKKCFNIHRAVLFRLIREAIFLFYGDINDISLKHIKYICDFVNKNDGKVIQIRKKLFCLNDGNYLKFLKNVDFEDDYKYFYEQLIDENEILNFKNRKINKIVKEVDFLGQKIKVIVTLEDGFKFNDFNMKALDYKYFSLDDVKNNICFRNRCHGDIFKPFGMNSRKKLKEFLINEKAVNKNKIPLICFDNTIVWVFKFRNSEDYKVLSDSKTIIKIKLEYL